MELLPFAPEGRAVCVCMVRAPQTIKEDGGRGEIRGEVQGWASGEGSSILETTTRCWKCPAGYYPRTGQQMALKGTIGGSWPLVGDLSGRPEVLFTAKPRIGRPAGVSKKNSGPHPEGGHVVNEIAQSRCRGTHGAVQRRRQTMPKHDSSRTRGHDCMVGDADRMIICDGCEGCYHTYCNRLGMVPEGDWLCHRCCDA